jgi:hypothetical protein
MCGACQRFLAFYQLLRFQLDDVGLLGTVELVRVREIERKSLMASDIEPLSTEVAAGILHDIRQMYLQIQEVSDVNYSSRPGVLIVADQGRCRCTQRLSSDRINSPFKRCPRLAR